MVQASSFDFFGKSPNVMFGFSISMMSIDSTKINLLTRRDASITEAFAAKNAII
jgi:hypothetical protein